MCVGDFVSISSWSDPRTGQCIYDEYSRELCSAAAVSVTNMIRIIMFLYYSY